MSTKAIQIFKSYMAALPARQRRMRERNPGLAEEYVKFEIEAPKPVPQNIQTLDVKIFKPMSPQLRDWYSLTGTLMEGSWKYLSPEKIQSVVRAASIKTIVAAHREHWDESAPGKFQDSQLSIFGLVGSVDDGDVIYFVWPETGGVEPELWEYFGQSETRYKDIVSYIASLMKKQ